MKWNFPENMYQMYTNTFIEISRNQKTLSQFFLEKTWTFLQFEAYLQVGVY